jgi:hypothetical protein
MSVVTGDFVPGEGIRELLDHNPALGSDSKKRGLYEEQASARGFAQARLSAQDPFEIRIYEYEPVTLARRVQPRG